MWVRGQRQAQLLYPRNRDSFAIVQVAGKTPEPVWTGAQNLAPIQIPSPYRPAHSQSLYLLRYTDLSLSLHALKINLYIPPTSRIPEWFPPLKVFTSY
jgi:hypothetical protein